MVTFGTTEGGKQDALGNVQRDIESVRGIMTENIERVLERGERIDLLVDKTDRLGVGAHDFRVRSRGLKRQMWWKNVKLMVLLGVVVVFLVYLFVGFGCGLPGESSPFLSPVCLSFRFGTAVNWKERDGFLEWKLFPSTGWNGHPHISTASPIGDNHRCKAIGVLSFFVMASTSLHYSPSVPKLTYTFLSSMVTMYR